MSTCASCQQELKGDGLSCIKGKFYCQKCSKQFSVCPICSSTSIKDDACYYCDYKRQKCGKCGKTVDEAIWRLNILLCNICANPPQPKPQPKPKPKSETDHYYDLQLGYCYIPPDSPGCYRRDVCKGHCTCDSPN